MKLTWRYDETNTGGMMKLTWRYGETNMEV